jgi:hypothetical protein
MHHSKSWKIIIVVAALGAAVLACETSSPQAPRSTPTWELPLVAPEPAFERDRTAYGFFLSPPEATFEALLNHFSALGEHADFVLMQPNIPWEDFQGSVDGESQGREDLRNQIILAQRNNLDWIFVVDPLNGLNRSEFYGLPPDWEASFANPDVRAAFTHFALWIVQEFEPRYLGLASEINTYMDAHPDDVENYLTLYTEVYDLVKAQAPASSIFVTFQWDDLNNMFPSVSEGRRARDTNWDQIEAFEPRLDLWVISSYPYFVFPRGEDIPQDYYTPLLSRTDKPLAVAEGGWSSQPVGPAPGDPDSQIHYLEAIHTQLGDRMAFWVYILLSDLNMESIKDALEGSGLPPVDLDTLSLFANVGLRSVDGTPKPALQVWDRYRTGE